MWAVDARAAALTRIVLGVCALGDLATRLAGPGGGLDW